MHVCVCVSETLKLFKCGDEFLFIHIEKSGCGDPKGKGSKQYREGGIEGERDEYRLRKERAKQRLAKKERKKANKKTQKDGKRDRSERKREV